MTACKLTSICDISRNRFRAAIAAANHDDIEQVNGLKQRCLEEQTVHKDAHLTGDGGLRSHHQVLGCELWPALNADHDGRPVDSDQQTCRHSWQKIHWSCLTQHRESLRRLQLRNRWSRSQLWSNIRRQHRQHHRFRILEGQQVVLHSKRRWITQDLWLQDDRIYAQLW